MSSGLQSEKKPGVAYCAITRLQYALNNLKPALRERSIRSAWCARPAGQFSDLPPQLSSKKPVEPELNLFRFRQ
jgi:hypothetical protein